MAKPDYITEGEAVIQQLWDLIDMYPSKGADYLSHLLKSEIKRFGPNKMAEALSQMPYDAISSAENILFYEESSENIHKALVELAEMIKGVVTDADTAKEFGDVMDEL